MADILIKNYPMPKEGFFKLLIYPEGDVFYVNPYNEAVCSTNAKAIEVDDCRRLVNKDDVLGCIKKRKDFADKVCDEICVDLCHLLMEDVNGLPTIVEASNGSDN